MQASLLDTPVTAPKPLRAVKSTKPIPTPTSGEKSVSNVLQELLKQQEELAAKIQIARLESVSSFYKEVDRLLSDYGVTAQELVQHYGGALPTKEKVKRASPKAKYLDPATGTTWSGRGRMPRAFTGKVLSEMLIK